MSWIQASEMTFISNLGRYTKNASVAPAEVAQRRVKVLEGYLRALPNRRKWFSGSKIGELYDHATKCLENARAAKCAGASFRERHAL